LGCFPGDVLIQETISLWFIDPTKIEQTSRRLFHSKPVDSHFPESSSDLSVSDCSAKGFAGLENEVRGPILGFE
jgi:hypothetical protein